MGRPPKRKEQPTPETQASSAAPTTVPATPAAPPPPSAEEAASTITLRLDDKGRILPLRDETRERLKQALESSDLGEGYKPRPAGKFVDEAFAGRLLDALGAAQSFVFSKSAKIPYAKAAEAMRFDNEDKKSLASPTSALLNQYAGAWLTRHGVLLEFSVKFAAIEASKLDKAVALAREHGKEAPQ